MVSEKNSHGSSQSGDNTRRGNQGAVNNPPQAGPSRDADKFTTVPGVSSNTQATARQNEPAAAGGPQGSELHRDAPRTKTQGGFSAPDSKRGWTDSDKPGRDEQAEEELQDEQ